MAKQPDTLKLDLEEVAEFRSLERGDHLAVESRWMFVKYFHHGIFLGQNEVADFGSNTKNKAEFRKIDLCVFRGNRRLFKYIYPVDRCNTPEVTAHLAEEVTDNPELWGTYDMQTNNCEHFATRCKVGKAYSIQVEKVTEKFREIAESVNSCAVL